MSRPLHVKVAEALGWTRINMPGYEWRGVPYPGGVVYSSQIADDSLFIPRYDTDWTATGPLIERYGLDVGAERDFWSASVCDPDRDFDVARGSTPLIAVCNLILDLHAVGRLKVR